MLLVVSSACLRSPVYWFATGGRWLIVETPSMGRSAPVGTLLWVEPVHDLHVGDVISFHPPGEPKITYTPPHSRDRRRRDDLHQG